MSDAESQWFEDQGAMVAGAILAFLNVPESARILEGVGNRVSYVMRIAAAKEREAILDLVDIDREETCLDYQWGEDRNSAVAQQTHRMITDAIRARKTNLD